MADRYISRNAFAELLKDYQDLRRWNTDVCDPDTVLRVLGVLSNELDHMKTIGSRQLSSKLLAAKDCALAFYEEQAWADMERYQEAERQAETTNNTPMMYYWRGMKVRTMEDVETFKYLQGGEIKEKGQR